MFRTGLARQVFSTSAWLTSVIPTVTAPRVARAKARGDTEEVQKAIGEALFFATARAERSTAQRRLLASCTYQHIRTRLQMHSQEPTLPSSFASGHGVPHKSQRRLQTIVAIIDGFTMLAGAMGVATFERGSSTYAIVASHVP